MDFQVWNALLFGLKWIFLGLVFLMLSIVLLAVRRELATRMAVKPAEITFTPGRLRVITPGSDRKKKAGELLELKPVTSLGSEMDNEIILTDAYISRHHARLRWDGAMWSIEDLGSQNGTFINRSRCEPFQTRIVPSGAVVQMGEMSFELIE